MGAAKKIKAAVKPKAGRVVRLTPVIQKFIEQRKQGKETVSGTLCRLLGLPNKKGDTAMRPLTFYILPESRVVCDSLPEAKGVAIMRAVKKGLKKPTERPIEVRAIE